MKLVGIIVIAALLIFGGYKIFASRVDRANPQEVATAFLKQLKRQEVDKAAKYYLPAESEAWAEATKKSLYQMKTNATEIFRNSIPDEPTFKDVPSPKGSTDRTLATGEVQVSLRQVDGEWWVTKSPY